MHLVRSLLDEVFGVENFVSLITFKKTSGATGEYLAGISDYIVWYAKDTVHLKFRQCYREREIGGLEARLMPEWSKRMESAASCLLPNLKMPAA